MYWFHCAFFWLPYGVQRFHWSACSWLALSKRLWRKRLLTHTATETQLCTDPQILPHLETFSWTNITTHLRIPNHKSLQRLWETWLPGATLFYEAPCPFPSGSSPQISWVQIRTTYDNWDANCCCNSAQYVPPQASHSTNMELIRILPASQWLQGRCED